MIINYIAAPESDFEENFDHALEEKNQMEPLYRFTQLTDIDAYSDAQQHVLDLANSNTVVPAAEMENLI